jgi:SAM-dependent methyltransferase
VVAWHDTECGAYSADLGLWDALARKAPGPLLELGSGTGRVALHLARAGREVIAVEREPELAAELERRAASAGVELTVIAADIRELQPGSIQVAPALVIAPMHVVQTFDRHGRRDLIEAAALLLAAGGTLALVVIDEVHSTKLASGDPLLLPDIREIGGWVFSSEPLWVQVTEEKITARRLRRRVAPGGELESSVHEDVLHRTPPEELEQLGAELGLRSRERQLIRSSPIESDSIVVILERP